MVWTGSTQYRLAPALLTLLRQLEAAYPGAGWLNSPQTGTIGDSAHFAEGSASDHNPWLDDTVRALDIAANVSGVAGIVAVADAPSCEALFAMVNQMYADRDPRVFPNGYAIYLRRITDWDNPGGYHAQAGDPHLYHLHISVSTNPVGFNSTAPWPISGAESTSSSGAKEIDIVTPDDIKAIAEAAAAAVWTSDFSGHGYKAPASTVLADALRNATTAAAADPMGKSLSRSGVGPAPREVWLADARNLAAQANDNASKALAGVNELAAVVAQVLQAVQRLSDLAGVPAAPVDPKQIVAALGTAITKGVSE